MNRDDKKTLALLINYLDEVVEKQVGSKLAILEKKIEHTSLKLNEDGLFAVESKRGPRGFKGLDGDPGAPGRDGRDADPRKVAHNLRLDEDFISLTRGPKGDPGLAGKDADPLDVAASLKEDLNFIALTRGSKGDQGLPGKDADPKVVAESLKRSKLFKESVRGDQGPRGDVGPQGIQGVGVKLIEASSDGIISYTTTDGESAVAGKLDLKSYDDASLKTELQKLKKELDKVRSDVTAQITRSVMAAGSSSGGGEVRIEFMDDFIRPSLSTASYNDIVVYDPVAKKFKVYNVSLDEVIDRINNIEDYLQINIPPLQATPGYLTLNEPLKQFLYDDGTGALIPRGAPDDLVYISKVTVLNSNNEIVEVGTKVVNESIIIDSNESLFNQFVLIDYMQLAANTGPFPSTVNVNNFIDQTGTLVTIPLSAIDAFSVESWNLYDSAGNQISTEFTITDTEIIIKSLAPIFGSRLDLMTNKTQGQGSDVLTYQLNGLSDVISFEAFNITKVNNYAVFDSNDTEISLSNYIYNDKLVFESNFDMVGNYVKVWFT